MKPSLFAFSFILSSLAFAEFDFQLEGRYNPVGPVVSRFTHIVPDGANGFYAGGKLGTQLIFARFDTAGNIIGSRHWSDPNSFSADGILRMERDDGGRINFSVVAGTANANNQAIVQLSPTLQPLWEYREGFGNGTLTTMHSSGKSIIVTRNFTTSMLDIRILNENGTLATQLSTPAPDAIYTVCAIPVPGDSSGFAISGRKNNQGWILRLNMQGTILYENMDTAMPGQYAGIYAMVADLTGTITGAGRAAGGFVSFYKVTPAGAITQAFEQSFPNTGVGGVQILDETTARTSYGEYGNSHIVDYDRNTLSVVRRYTTGGTIDSSQALGPYAQDTGGRIMGAVAWNDGNNSGRRFEEWTAPGGGMNEPESDLEPLAAVTLSGGAAKFVGWNEETNRAAINTDRTNDFINHEEFLLTGYASREHTNVAMSPAGDISFISVTANQIDDQVIKHPPLVSSFNGNGQLKFSRSFTGVNVPSMATQIEGAFLALDDGSLAILGRSSSNEDRPAIVRINAAGVVTNTRVYNFGSDVEDVRLCRIPGSLDVLMVLIRIGNMALVRVRPDGSFAYNVGYSPSNATTRLAPLASGKVAMLQTIRNKPISLRIIEPTTGLPDRTVQLVTEQVHGLLDIPGPAFAVITTTAGKIRTRRFDEATLSTTHTVDLPSGRTFVKAAVGTAGRIAVATAVGTTRKLIAYNGLNLSTALAEFDMPSNVREIRDMTITNANELYVLSGEASNALQTWVGKYSAAGALVKEQRPTGQPKRIFSTNVAIWVTTFAKTRHKGAGPAAFRYTR